MGQQKLNDVSVLASGSHAGWAATALGIGRVNVCATLDQLQRYVGVTFETGNSQRQTRVAVNVAFFNFCTVIKRGNHGLQISFFDSLPERAVCVHEYVLFGISATIYFALFSTLWVES